MSEELRELTARMSLVVSLLDRGYVVVLRVRDTIMVSWKAGDVIGDVIVTEVGGVQGFGEDEVIESISGFLRESGCRVEVIRLHV